ncbi:hypothetical protein SKTS_23950 [Sulfurimicrobium lacus]|uniref:Uncharacterized protein n=1 Tax=Sulfurimicrobium lacus TaxID=2715678 RepID=A0A6F8VFL1_9PROT|nr:hypothetical protein [Sulfurimicrobium lacus]BCB27509.1 hypothetical protein SKTS_23950 [Sulfurimicrobium lacus]
MSRYASLPVYEVEFIPAERRITQRCSPLQRINDPLPSGERRTSPGRRADDWYAYFAAGLSPVTKYGH